MCMSDELLREFVRDVVSEIIRKCGDKWCLYTTKKDPKTGKRRRLGTHDTKQDAYKQEYAIEKSKERS